MVKRLGKKKDRNTNSQVIKHVKGMRVICTYCIQEGQLDRIALELEQKADKGKKSKL